MSSEAENKRLESENDEMREALENGKDALEKSGNDDDKDD